MSIQVPHYIRSLVPYLPGKPIEETQREFGIKKVIKLASNENPLGPSPRAKKILQTHLRQLHRYPDGGGYHLKQALAKHLSVASQSLILGNGSNEVIDQLIRTFCLPGDSIVTPKASFIAYRLCAQIHGVQTHEVPLDENLRFNGDELVEAVRKNEKVRLVFIANPNNPTGTYLSYAETQDLIQKLSAVRDGSVLLVLDYAYWEYITEKDLPLTSDLLKLYPNLVLLRTFSKVYGLAGLRVGYGVASPELISHLEKVRQPFNLNSLALAAATEALKDKEFVKKAKKINQQGRRFWEKELKRLSIPFWKSQGNFLLVDVKKGLGKSGPDIYQACLEKGIIFRPVANYQLPDALRITIGTQSENEIAVKKLTQVGKK